VVSDTEARWVTPEEADALTCPRELPLLMRKALAVMAADRGGSSSPSA
jgi:hypothetical protein